MTVDLDELEAILAKIHGGASLFDDKTLERIVTVVNAAPELVRLARAGLRVGPSPDLLAFARRVLSRAKHRSESCTPDDCAKCEAEQILRDAKEIP